MKFNLMQAPFPYFGGKSAVADIVWDALGDVEHYMEPFFGSGAVLLARPNYDPLRHQETVCDKDGYVANAWRALRAAPDEVAKHCDWPVNHADLTARRRALIDSGKQLLKNLVRDDAYYDPKLAGYWIWGMSCWIGGRFTRDEKPTAPAGKLPRISDGAGIHKKSHIRDNAQTTTIYNEGIYEWFRALSKRLRYVRVVCDDWYRICGGRWQTRQGTCGIFFDPPYAAETGRALDLYHADDPSVSHDVRAWCIERGALPDYRIVLAGYADEHEELCRHGWTVHHWTRNGGYSNLNINGKKSDRHREALFFSPHCLRQQSLFNDQNKEDI